MKLTIAWNVWDTYEDLLLGSEIARLQNVEKDTFESLYLISQGGYHIPPSDLQANYIDQHCHIEVNEHLKWRVNNTQHISPIQEGNYRVLNGIRNAYEYALGNHSDYALVTNADAWCLDMEKLRNLLQEEKIARHAISMRIGLVTGLDLSWGSYVPFFDDHFIILNIGFCEKNGVFDYEEPRAYSPHFIDFGGIHYMLGALLDERVPPDLFYAYTNLENCVNHFGEKSGYGLLPWQYQPDYEFLHANATQDPGLHSLRAELLRLKSLDRYPEVSAYCKLFPKNHEISRTSEHVFYKQTILDKFMFKLHWWPRKFYWIALKKIRYATYIRIKKRLIPTFDSLRYLDLYKGVLPYSLSSRKRAKG